MSVLSVSLCIWVLTSPVAERAPESRYTASPRQALLTAERRDFDQAELSALNLLGIRYAKGRGVKKNPRLAMRFFLQSAIQGYTPAMANLGTLYETGAIGHVDFRRAYAWVRTALSFGVPEKDYDDTILKLWVIAQRLDPGRIESAERLAGVIGIEIVERCKCSPGQEPELASNWALLKVSSWKAPWRSPGH
jgi:TPR repeat protein